MSKSGLFAHFGSKESLQLATIEEARQRYVQEVIAPALASGSGITRLLALCEAFLSYIERGVFPGGCFFASAMAEFAAKEPSPVRDLISECQQQWMSTLERAAEDARANGSYEPTAIRASSPSSSKGRCCRPTGTSISSRTPPTSSVPGTPFELGFRAKPPPAGLKAVEGIPARLTQGS
jgi:hypothetical protein